MALTPDRSCLTADPSDYLFVDDAHPLSRSNRCLALHVDRAKSGQAGPDVQIPLNHSCDSLSARGSEVRSVRSDGDAGYNQRHHAFFRKWDLPLLHHGLPGALGVMT
jgi:hypothetical protein